MTVGMIGIILLVAFLGSFWSYWFGYKNGLADGIKAANKSIADYQQGNETPIAKNISNSYNKSHRA